MQYLIGLAILLLAILIYTLMALGKEREKRKAAEKIAAERTHDATVSAKPFVDGPFSRMRDKD